MKEAGEICDGNDLAGATCQSQGFTGGTLACNPTCSGFNSSGCCTNECSVGAAMCSGGVVQTCGNYDADTCYEYGGSQTCTNGQTCVGSGCGCVASNSGQFMVTDHVYPSFGPAGCSGDGLGKMKLSAQMTSPTTLTFYVRKEDNSSFTGSGTLRVFVGSGPNCTNVVNESKTTASIVVGQSTQTINLSLYNGSWALNETKQFWVGKEEGGNLAYRASSTVSVQRTCIP